jgi:general secretion pathway protein J
MAVRGTRAKERAGEAGYTLVELLIVLALLAVLAVLMTSGLHLGARAWEAGERANLSVREIALAQARLRHAIGEAYPYFSTADPAVPHVLFEGDARALTVLAADPAANEAGRSLTTIEARAGARGVDLVVRAVPELATESARGDARDEVLIRGLDRIAFAYLAEDGTTWLERWQNQKRPPRLVRLSVAFPAGDARAWPDLVVAPRVTADVACVFDPLTKSCRGR